MAVKNCMSAGAAAAMNDIWVLVTPKLTGGGSSSYSPSGMTSMAGEAAATLVVRGVAATPGV